MKPTVVRADEGKKISVLGDLQILKLTGKDTDGKLTVIMQELPEGAGVPLHTHSLEDENFQIIEGEVEVCTGDKTYVLTSGDTIYLPKSVPHSLKALKDSKLKINLVPAGIEGMFEELDRLPAGPPDFKLVTEICNRYGVTFT
ncbi:cupin domain-containing protein [Mucilaginibacter psychrotolerans]|uniref:Cupin domain-containing protein n=1 Tax=Mucilaginibacter psychrotolerans TaxID=1524096 RepID=A0A4Y8S9B6_9SPHI|nr:cupin domain-containing protein [Mucilaginibacter psychrotolerans]TFF35492.1 cupin domain-containing protein [Mucilaginibacter psychrotolerans]